MTPCAWCARLHDGAPEACLSGVVLVTGGRDYRDGWGLAMALDLVALRVEISAIRHGGALGADRLAGLWARKRGVAVEEMPAEWKQYGKRAGPIRNQAMLDRDPPPVLGVALPGSNGTADMVGRLRRAQVPVWCVGTDTPGEVMRDVLDKFWERSGRRMADGMPQRDADLAALREMQAKKS